MARRKKRFDYTRDTEVDLLDKMQYWQRRLEREGYDSHSGVAELSRQALQGLSDEIECRIPETA